MDGQCTLLTFRDSVILKLLSLSLTDRVSTSNGVQRNREIIFVRQRERYSGGSRPSAKKGKEEEEEQDEEEEGGDEEDRLEKGKKGEGEGKW